MKINQLKAGVMLSYVSELVMVLSGLIYTPVMLRLLGQSEYGLYQLSASVISYLGLLSMGMGSGYVRYYYRRKTEKNPIEAVAKLNGMYMLIFIVIGIICALAGSVLVANVDLIFKNSLTARELETARILMTIMVFNLAISFPGSVFSSHITANEQYIFQRVVNILSHILNPFLTLPLLFLGYKSIAIVTVQTTVSILSLVANIIFCKKKLGIKFCFKGFEWGFLKELFAFSFFIFLNMIIDKVNWQVDKFILGVYGGTVAVAVYSVASHLNDMYLSFSTSISSVFAPRVNRLVASECEDEVLTDLFTRVGRIQFMIMVLVLSGLTIFGEYFISLWAGEGYELAYPIVLLLVIPVTISLIQNLGIEIQRAKNKHQFRSVVYAIIAVINVLVSIPLTKYYGGIGAAIGTALSLLVGNGLIMNIYYHKKIGIDIIYFWKQILSFVPSLIIPFVCGFLIMRFVKMDNIFIFLVLILVYSAVYCASLWKFGMNDSEKDLIRKPLNKLFGRLKHD